MNKYKLSLAGIKANEGIKRFNGNADMYEKYLRGFAEDDHYPKLLQSMEQNDVEQAFQAAHALKGIVGNLSIEGMEVIVKPLVEDLRGKDIDTARDKMPQLQESYEKVIAALQEM